MQIERYYHSGDMLKQFEKNFHEIKARLQAYEMLLPVVKKIVGKKINARLKSFFPEGAVRMAYCTNDYYVRVKKGTIMVFYKTSKLENSTSSVRIELGPVNDVVSNEVVAECESTINGLKVALERADKRVKEIDDIKALAESSRSILKTLADKYDVSFARDFNLIYDLS